jgi:F-type H+-transporting ATPase subunit c
MFLRCLAQFSLEWLSRRGIININKHNFTQTKTRDYDIVNCITGYRCGGGQRMGQVGCRFCGRHCCFAGAWGIGKIGKTALECIARQPEAGNDLRQSMIVAAALIEGVTFFAIVVCLLILFV